MLILGYIVIALAAYLLGSIPTGFLVAKARGVDIRAVGSGNIGATNAMRVLGKRAGIFVLVVDGLKGYAACAWLCDGLLPVLGVPAADTGFHVLLAGVAVVLGHNYTCWLYFKGGKGIATTAGAFVALAPLALAIAVAAWIVVFLLTRFVSVGSLAAAVALPTAVWLTKDSVALGVMTTGIGLLAIAKHKANIQRLLAGTEHQVSFHRKPTSA